MNWDPRNLSDAELLDLVRRAGAQNLADRWLIDDVVGMALTGFDLRDPDAMLADLSFDSETVGAAADGLRATTVDARARTFEAEGITIDFEDAAGELIGQVMPVPTELVYETLHGRTVVPVDDHGQFSVRSEASPGRFRIETAQGTIVTEWFEIDVA